ncbi:MAG: 50S ribosomal protein L29 [Candidatus Methanofastidiosa archaeon]|nr:50S ribosomal protein L29 [Candidatus Methanofastidiosa archaeon]
MKIHEIREITSIEELKAKIKEEEKNLEELKFLLATRQLENTAKIRNTKRDIARMKTVLTERERNIRVNKKNSK